MDNIGCSGCDQTFCSRYNLLRHVRNKHSKSGDMPERLNRSHLEAYAPQEESDVPGAHLGAPGAHLGAPGAHLGAPGAHLGAPPPQGVPPPQPKNDVKLVHPFTMIVSGPTSCGKTFFVKMLLQTNGARISPPSQRIVWLYKRWQPLYDVILQTVLPRVEFMQGIPLDLENDTFFDPTVRNTIVLDDLMSSASKDPRISDLFTEGSHHRNLSVIVLNQNLYHNKDPTQRRNCQYLVLFKNPVDKQSVVTLARQMYPGKTSYFIKKYEEATKKPYSFLLIDLKPTTLENDRLKSNISSSGPGSCMNTADASMKNYFPIGNQKYNTGTVTEPGKHQPNFSVDLITENPDMVSCDDCGLMFANMHDLQRHVKKWCPEKEEEHKTTKRKQNDDNVVIPDKYHKRARSMGGEIEDNEEASVYVKLMELSKSSNEEQWTEKFDKYIAQGLSEKEATDKADTKMESADLKQFTNRYSSLIQYILQLRHGSVHTQVMNAVSDYLSEGYTEKRAIRMAIKRFRHSIEEYFEGDSDNETETEEESDNE